MPSTGFYRDQLFPVIVFVVGTYGLSAVVGAAAAIVLGDTGTEPHPVVFMGGFLLALVTISHQLFHRLRFVDPVEFIRISLIIGYVISAGAAVLYVAQTLSASQVDFVSFLVGLVGLAVAPILIVLPTVLALGDKPPPDEYD